MDQAPSQQAAERAPAESEGKLIQVRLEMVCWQTVTGAWNKCFGIADHDMQPSEHTVAKVVVLVLMGVVFQSQALTVAEDDAARLHDGIGEFLYRGMLDIPGHTHLKILRIGVFIQ